MVCALAELKLVALDVRFNPLTLSFYPVDTGKPYGDRSLNDATFVRQKCWRACCVDACTLLETLDGVRVGVREREKSARTLSKLRKSIAATGRRRVSELVRDGGMVGGDGEESLFRDWKPVSYPMQDDDSLRENGNLVLKVATPSM